MGGDPQADQAATKGEEAGGPRPAGVNTDLWGGAILTANKINEETAPGVAKVGNRSGGGRGPTVYAHSVGYPAWVT